jgi:DNA-binding Lrp family transcriptional regulator
MAKRLHKKDLRILYQLDTDARQPLARIARNVGLSEQVTGYRIRRLTEEHIIKHTFTILNPAVFGQTHFKVYLRLQNIAPEVEEAFVQHLIRHPYSFWVVSCRGRWDIIVSFFATDVKQFGKLLRDILNRYDQYIAERNVVAVEEAPSFTRGYLDVGQEPKQLEYGGKPEPVQLDEVDIQLLMQISQNARTSLLDIGTTLKMTSEGVRHRLKRLRETGVIQHYGIIPDLKALGYEQYLTSLTFKNLDEKNWKRLITFCKYSRNILFMPRCIGEHDVDIELEVRGNEEYNILLDRLRTEFKDILRDFETVLITKQHKFDYFPMGKELFKKIQSTKNIH